MLTCQNVRKNTYGQQSIQRKLPKSETLNIGGYFQQLSTHVLCCCMWQDWISFPGDKQEGCYLTATETAKLEKINLSDSETTLLI